jgi:hypothetical protein
MVSIASSYGKDDRILSRNQHIHLPFIPPPPRNVLCLTVRSLRKCISLSPPLHLYNRQALKWISEHTEREFVTVTEANGLIQRAEVSGWSWGN